MALEQQGGDRLCFGGRVRRYTHASAVLGCNMVLSVFIPPNASDSNKAPVLYWLSGLTCTDENFITKAGAQRAAAARGLLLVCPDTSPRGCNIPGEDASWDFGSGAGFYVDATQEPWAKHYRMYSYITDELPRLVGAALPADLSRQSITGHSMGGHGALICALKNPGKYRSVSAFAPISNPIECPWGVKAFSGYLGDDRSAWREWDATELAKSYAGPKLDILVSQGTADSFLTDKQLLPEALAAAASNNDALALTLNMEEGYDHSYYFIATFIDQHIEHHSAHLLQ